MAAHEIQNPDCTGWRWEDAYEGFDGVYQHEIIWLHGTDSVTYWTRAPGNSWTHTKIVDPERLGFDGTVAGARRLVESFTA